MATPIPRNIVRRERFVLVLRRETMVVARGFFLDFAHRSHIGNFQHPSGAIRKQILGERAEERIGVVQQRPAKAGRAVKFCPIEHLSPRVDGKPGIVDPPRAHRIEILEREPDRVHHLVAGSAYRVGAMLFQSFANRKGLGIFRRLFKRRHHPRRRRWRGS
jgi:hypothetical protein